MFMSFKIAGDELSCGDGDRTNELRPEKDDKDDFFFCGINICDGSIVALCKDM